MKYIEEVSEAIAFIEANICSPLTVKRVSELAGLSSWHFQRIFWQLTGETIGSYIRRRRLAGAADEIKKHNRKIIDVAMMFEFGSSEAFSRAFKNEFGLSPQQFRNSKVPGAPFRKPALDPERLRYIANDMGIAPDFVTIDPIMLAGIPVSFISPLARPLDYMEAVTNVWKKFISREHEIPQKTGAIKVGLIENISSIRHHLHDNFIDYAACTPISGLSELPSGLRAFEIPSGKYAVFHAKGFHEQTQFMIDYVYSTWLPQSSFQRTEGPEFTWLDHRKIELSAASSPVDYYFPIV